MLSSFEYNLKYF